MEGAGAAQRHSSPRRAGRERRSAVYFPGKSRAHRRLRWRWTEGARRRRVEVRDARARFQFTGLRPRRGLLRQRRRECLRRGRQDRRAEVEVRDTWPGGVDAGGRPGRSLHRELRRRLLRPRRSHGPAPLEVHDRRRTALRGQGPPGLQPKTQTFFDPWDMYESSPVVGQGAVYFGSGDGNVYALDQWTGALRWKFKTGDVVHASPRPMPRGRSTSAVGMPTFTPSRPRPALRSGASRRARTRRSTIKSASRVPQAVRGHRLCRLPRRASVCGRRADGSEEMGLRPEGQLGGRLAGGAGRDGLLWQLGFAVVLRARCQDGQPDLHRAGNAYPSSPRRRSPTASPIWAR